MSRIPTEARSNIMKGNKGKNTKPEIAVRRALHAKGYRFRLHRRDLPGCPDIVLPRFRLVIFVHGCFWHQHKNCSLSSSPRKNTKFWNDKFRKNKERDRVNQEKLENGGWIVKTIWECETQNLEALNDKIDEVLEETTPWTSLNK